MSKLRWNTITVRPLDEEEKEYYKNSYISKIIEGIPEDGEECLLSNGCTDVFINEGLDGCGWEGNEVENGQKWVSIQDVIDYLNAEQIKEKKNE